MGIQIKGSNDTISASDGSMVLEGSALTFDNESITGISTMGTGHITGTATIDDDLKVGISTLFVDVSAGRVGVGTDNPQGELHVNRASSTGRIIVEGASNAQIGLRDNAGGTDTKVIQIRNTTQNLLIGTQNDSYGSFSEKFRITSNGELVVGTTSGDTTYQAHIKHNTYGLLKLETDLTGADGAYLDLYHNSTSPADEDQLGSIGFKGKNSADEETTYARIQSRSSDVTDGTEDGYLTFHTRAAGNFAERVRILSNGRIGVGTDEATSALQIYAADLGEGTAKGQIVLKDTAAYNASPTAGVVFQGHHASNNAQAIFAAIRGFKANTADGDYDGCLGFDVRTHGDVAFEAMRIDESGRLRVASTTESADTAFDDVIIGDYSNNRGISILSSGTGQGALGFAKSGTTADGYVAYQHNSTATSSVMTLKSSGEIRFHPGSTERARFDSDGRMIIVRSGSGGELNSNDAALHVNAPTDGGQGGIYVHCNSQSGGTASPHYGIKIDAVNCANNANLQAGLLIDVDQQYTQSGTGVQSDVAGSYSTQTCYHAKLTKNLSAVTSGYSYFSNIVTSGSGGNAYHMRCEDDGSLKLLIEKNGDVKNSNNSFSAISDVKLKENIVDASSQWDDIKAVKVRNFNFIADSNNTKMIGVVAQEIETVSAGLVDTDNDITVDDATGEGTITGTTKSVKYSILYMKAIKALQEAMTRIETLETKVAALESA